MGLATAKGNEVKSKMKQPSDVYLGIMLFWVNYHKMWSQGTLTEQIYHTHTEMKSLIKT